jgi:hypothetical protein
MYFAALLLLGAVAQAGTKAHAPPNKLAPPYDDVEAAKSESSDSPEAAEPTPEPVLPKFDPKWRTCKEDKDCIAIDTLCGWGCINGGMEQPASRYYHQLAPMIECNNTARENKPPAICVKKECACQR